MVQAVADAGTGLAAVVAVVSAAASTATASSRARRQQPVWAGVGVGGAASILGPSARRAEWFSGLGHQTQRGAATGPAQGPPGSSSSVTPRSSSARPTPVTVRLEIPTMGSRASSTVSVTVTVTSFGPTATVPVAPLRVR